MNGLPHLEREQGVNGAPGRSLVAAKLSTDGTRSSSAHYSFKTLANVLLLALAANSSAVAQSSSVTIAPSVGERLAADLTWSQQERDQRFRRMDALFPIHRVQSSGRVRKLPHGLPIPPGLVQRYMEMEHLAGVLVLQNGAIRAERYALGLTPEGSWTTFSVTKSLTDTLVGAALHSSSIQSLDDPVSRYLPEMDGTAYQDVSVGQLLTMTSGVRWHESYTSATADNVLLYRRAVPPGVEPVTAYMRTLPREAAPGTRWNYNTGETDLLGVLLRRATGETLAEQLSDTIWKAAGMEAGATWISTAPGRDGEEFGGSGISATLRDLGRFGQWVLEGGSGVVDNDWFATATRTQVKAGSANYGYGWWPLEGGCFAALGIFGQSIFVDPARKLVIVSVGDWSEATGTAHSAARAAFWRSVQSAVDTQQR